VLSVWVETRCRRRQRVFFLFEFNFNERRERRESEKLGVGLGKCRGTSWELWVGTYGQDARATIGFGDAIFGSSRDLRRSISRFHPYFAAGRGERLLGKFL
jgi:hypothetical protein